MNGQNAWNVTGRVSHSLVLIEKVARGALWRHYFDPSHCDLFWLGGRAHGEKANHGSWRPSISASFEHDRSREKGTRVAHKSNKMGRRLAR